MLLYGAGGHAKTVISCLHKNGIPINGIFDDNPFKKEILSIPVTAPYDPGMFPTDAIIITVGDNGIRRAISKIVLHSFGKVIHPSVMLGSDVQIMDGTVVMHHAVIQLGTIIGRHVIVNTGAIIEHDCTIGNFVHIAPSVTLCGHVNVGENTLIGAGSIVVPKIVIGKNCLIAAGSVITSNIPDGAVVRGNPGRIIKVCS
jgi:sugar O-acyltransferase (sialic acid O-acetyltransferase NeuD family)